MCAAGSGCSEEAQCLHPTAVMNAAMEVLSFELKSLIHNSFLTLEMQLCYRERSSQKYDETVPGWFKTHQALN